MSSGNPSTTLRPRTELAEVASLYPDVEADEFRSQGGDHPLLRKGFIFDVDGVLCRDDNLVPRADEAIERLRRGGKEDDLVLSTYATAQYVAKEHPGARVYMVGAVGLRKELELAGLDLVDDPFQAEYVVTGAPFDGKTGRITEENVYRITGALRALYHANAKFVATNPDRVFPAPDGVIRGTGAIIGTLSYMLDRPPDVIIGKPSAYIVRMALARLGLTSQECLIVGDMDTDMLAGRRSGMTTVYVRSGAMTEEKLGQLGITPDFGYDSVIDILNLEGENYG